MNKTAIITLLVLFSTVFASCGSAGELSAGNTNSAADFNEPAAERLSSQSANSASDREKTADLSENAKPSTALPADQPEPAVERKIIRNADLKLESSEPEKAQQTITSVAESKGGYVVESTQRGSDSSSAARDTVTMSLRVPSEKFNETLDEIRKTATRVVIETVSGQDVTEEFIDIEARLKAKKALEEQFLEIMKRSNSVADALNVQREIANVRAEIEQIEGRKRFLENQSSLSTIKVTLQTPTAIAGSSKGFFYRLTDAVSDGLNVALGFVLFFVSFLIAVIPFLLLVVLPIVLVIRYFFKRSAKKAVFAGKSADKVVIDEIKD